MFGSIGWQEIILIILIILLLFGASRIPEVMKSLGKGVREFKKAIKGIESEVDEKEEPSTKDVGSPKDEKDTKES